MVKIAPGKNTVLEICMILIGTAFTAISYYLFMKPNNIIAPGLGGVAVLISYFLPLSLGVIYLILNIPLFILGYRYVGGKFVMYSLLGMLFLSMFLAIFEFIIGFQQPILGTLLGGIFNGTSIAFVLLAGGSTGGLDIACVVVNKRWPKLTIGKVMFFINAGLVLVSGFIFGFLNSIYTILSIYLAGKALDICYSIGTKVRGKLKEVQKMSDF